MPAIQPPAKVLVSGATGYIAAWVVQNLLERGYAVRGTARSVAKGDYLKKSFARYGDRFEVVIVEDITQVSLKKHRDIGMGYIVVFVYRPFRVRMGHLTKRSKEWMPSNTQRRLFT